MRSSSLLLPNSPSSFFTAGGGPLDLPPPDAICKPQQVSSVTYTLINSFFRSRSSKRSCGTTSSTPVPGCQLQPITTSALFQTATASSLWVGPLQVAPLDAECSSQHSSKISYSGLPEMCQPVCVRRSAPLPAQAHNSQGPAGYNIVCTLKTCIMVHYESPSISTLAELSPLCVTGINSKADTTQPHRKLPSESIGNRQTTGVKTLLKS